MRIFTQSLLINLGHLSAETSLIGGFVWNIVNNLSKFKIENITRDPQLCAEAKTQRDRERREHCQLAEKVSPLLVAADRGSARLVLD